MNELGGYAFADLRVGMCATFAKTITEADIVLFAAVSGDVNDPNRTLSPSPGAFI
jgi:3-hydroxybutyryl-CoA dehydratase